MERVLQRGAFWAAAVLVALVFAALAAAFLCGAVYLWFCAMISRPMAALATAGVALFVAFLVLLTAYLSAAARQPPAQGTAEDRLAAALGNLVGREYAAFAKEHTIQAMLVTLAGGFVVGASPKLRAFLLRLLEP